jgi:RpiR family carbohydrate utilization transcriptional regulator
MSEQLSAVLLKMQELKGSLSKSGQKVIDYIIKNPDEVIYLSIAGFAENCGVSDATVVRTCQHLGMSGYYEMKVKLAQSIVNPIQIIQEDILENDSDEVIISRVFHGSLNALNYTLDILNMADIVRVVDMIIKAKCILICGLGNSHAIALDLHHKLTRLGILSICLVDSHIQTIAAVKLWKDNVMFCISHSGSSTDVVDAAARMKERGGKVISLTNIGNSPLSRIADIALHTASKETHYKILGMSSRIAQLVIIDSIHTLIATKTPDAVTGFTELEEALKNKKY